MEETKYIIGLKQGDREVFKSVFYTFYPPLVTFASRYVGDDAAEELVQDLMVDLWSNREDINISSSLKSYLFQATKNRALNVIRQKQREEKRYSIVLDQSQEIEEEAYDRYIYRELTENVNKAIDDLPDVYKETFKLSRLTALSNKEVAKKQGVSIKTVEYRITQSLKILRVKLRDYLSYIILF